MRADNPALVRAALEAGMTHFDTAHGYQKGKNEEMLGDVLKDYPRDSFIIGTKVHPEEVDRKTGQFGPGTTSEAFLKRFEISLQRLKMEYVDILYLHGMWSKESINYPPLVEALTKVKQQGKAKHLGVSTHMFEPAVINAVAESNFYDVVLTAFNFKHQHLPALKEAIAKAAAAGIGIVGMKTMAGAYFDKERTKPINCKAALKWVLQNENVTTTIPGITTFEQLAENASVNEDITLTEQEKTDLALGKSEGSLFCNGCDHCPHNCRKSLPISDIMRAYTYAYGYNNATMGKELLFELGINNNPCSDCSACTVQCIKVFNVSERIADISRLATIPIQFLS
jgi:predicted aldo/keto reductase-like oxidoreductase